MYLLKISIIYFLWIVVPYQLLNVKLVIVILNEMNIIALQGASSVFLVIVILNEMNIYVTFVELSCALYSNNISGKGVESVCYNI